MAKRTFKHFTPRDKPKKRPRRHKKNLNKNERRDHKNITDKADELSRQYEKTKDPRIRDQWFKLVRSVPRLPEPTEGYRIRK